MPATFGEFLWTTASEVMRHGIEHLHHQIDQQPPQAAAISPVPPVPTWPKPPWAMAEASAPTAAALATPPPPWAQTATDPPVSAPHPPTTAPVPDRVPSTGWSYADDVAAGTACLQCLRHHLGATVGALDLAYAAVQRGDGAAAQGHLARAKGELTVLFWFDLTPEKVQAAPPGHQALIARLQPDLTRLHAALPTPEPVAGMWGAVDESIRFARSPRPTPRDLAEIRVRLQRAETVAATWEREVLGPGSPMAFDAQAAGQARDAIREGRHVLDQGSLTDPATLERAAAWYRQAAAALTPVPDADTVAAWRTQARQCQETFYRAYLAQLAPAHTDPPVSA